MAIKVRKDVNIAEIGGIKIVEETHIDTKDEGLLRGQTGHHKRLLVVKVGTQVGIDETIEDVITEMNVKTSDDMDTIIMNQEDAVEITIEEIDVSHHLDVLKRLLKK